MSEIPLAAPISAEEDVLTADTPCRQCDYNLRGLRVDQLCSECGTPVSRSLGTDQLCNSNPEWLSRIALGVRLCAWSFIGAFICSLVVGLAMVVLSVNSRPAGARSGAAMLAVAMPVITFVAQVIAQIGAYLISSPELGGVDDKNLARCRRIIRWAILTSILASVGGQSIQAIGFSGGAGMAILFLLISMFVLSTAAEYAKFMLYRDWARRIPDRLIQRRSNFLRFAYVISLGVQGLASFSILFMMILRGPKVTLLSSWIVGLPSLVVFVFSVMLVIMLLRLGKALKQSAEIARDRWNSQSETQGAPDDRSLLSSAAIPVPLDQTPN